MGYNEVEGSYASLERVVVDLAQLGVNNEKGEKQYLFCVVDHFLRKARVNIFKIKSSLEYAKAIMKIIQKIYPTQIKLIQSDNGREFKKQLNNYNIKHIKSRSYDPKY